MKVALIGASGFIGSRLLAELAARGHAVTAIVRTPEKVADLPGVTAVKGDVFDKDGLAKLLSGHDAVISAVHFTASDPQILLAAVKQSGVKRYLVVGGAGSLDVAPGVRLFDTPEFPTIYLDEARKGGAFLDLLKQEQGLDWTFLSPSALIQPGEHTGKFRLGTDTNSWSTPRATVRSRPRITRSPSSTSWRSPRTAAAVSPSATESRF